MIGDPTEHASRKPSKPQQKVVSTAHILVAKVISTLFLSIL
jgi:hypothetical protein